VKDSDKPAEVDADDDANSTDWAAAAAAVAVVAVQWKRKRLLCPSSSRQPTHVQHTAVSGGDSAQLCVVADKPATHPVSHLVSWRCDRWGISQASRLHPLPFRCKVETSALNLHCRFHIRTRMCMPAPDILRTAQSLSLSSRFTSAANALSFTSATSSFTYFEYDTHIYYRPAPVSWAHYASTDFCLRRE